MLCVSAVRGQEASQGLVGYAVPDMNGRAPVSFFVKGLAALAVLFLVTLLMAPRPEVTVVRAMIAVGAAITLGKIVLRHSHSEWPSRRQ